MCARLLKSACRDCESCVPTNIIGEKVIGEHNAPFLAKASFIEVTFILNI